MTELFNKLKLGARREIHVLNAPASFEPELAALGDVRVHRSASAGLRFALAFVITQAECDVASAALAQAREGDALLWMIFPKARSKRYRCEFNRDSGWQVLGAAGFEPVSIVAVDEDWSGLRFRRVEHIPRMVRHPDGAISQAGRRKTSARSA